MSTAGTGERRTGPVRPATDVRLVRAMKVLLIEDSSVIRSSLEKGLRLSGFAVDTAGDGEEGLWRARGGGYDVIVLDLMLPKLGGLALLDRLRSAGDKTAVLILTARDAVEERVRGFEHGAQDYLIKPFAFAELVARIRSLCGRSFGMDARTIRCGELVLDLNARRADCAGHAIEFARREYMLLEYLMLRRGHVVSRVEIEEHLYDDSSEVQSNAVDAAMVRVRRKLDVFPGAPRITTKRGSGWMLDEPR